MLKGFTFDILVFVFRYRKCERFIRNRLFGYTTAYNNSEGAILSWIAPYGYPPDESRGEAEKRKRRILNAPPLNKPLPMGLYAGIKDD